MIKCTEECKNGCHFYVHEKCYKTCDVMKKQFEEMARENEIMKDALNNIADLENLGLDSMDRSESAIITVKEALYELNEKAE